MNEYPRVYFGKWHFYVWILFKNKREEGERESEKEREKERGFYIKFTEEFGQAVISAAVKADRLFIESYQTLCCLNKDLYHVFKSRSVPFNKEEKICFLIF